MTPASPTTTPAVSAAAAPSRFPATFRNETAIDPADLAAADAVFRSDGADDDIVAWRNDCYVSWRTGWNAVAGKYLLAWVHDHDTAVALVAERCGCIHRWVSTGERYDDTNPVLGTWVRGVWCRCDRCGERHLQITSRHNYSGD